jgi:hypothetical protein
MPSISITRLELRGLRFLPSFFWHTSRSNKQLRSAPGYLAGGTLFESMRAFWTVTAWQDADAMRAFRNAGAHMAAMRRLIDICSGAAYAHWQQDTLELPAPDEIHTRMLASGKLSKVRHPSALQQAGKAAGDKLPRGFRAIAPESAAATRSLGSSADR